MKVPVSREKASALTLVLLLCSMPSQAGETFSLPDSLLLFAGAWNFELRSPFRSELITLPLNSEGKWGPAAAPSLSSDGSLVFSGFPVANDINKRWGVRCAVGIYSRADRRWRTFGAFNQVHSGAISPDGSRVAFLADDDSRELLLLDLRTEQITVLRQMTAASVSWSPDGHKLVVGSPPDNEQIEIFDLASRTTKPIAQGLLPAWSPSGQWIAYVDDSGREIRLVHPDGSGDHIVKRIGSWFAEVGFGLVIVWSPDGTKLLLNEYKGANLDSRDVVLLDLKTGKMTRELHNGVPIFGWAPLGMLLAKNRPHAQNVRSNVLY